MPPPSTALLQGTLDVLILKVLALEPMHGLGVSKRIAQVTKGTFQVKPGSLFPALHRMEQAGWLSAEWGES
jgi:DNA-binding PadR family transcriptional regulator